MARPMAQSPLLDRFIASSSITKQDFLSPDVGPIEITYRELSEILRQLWISILGNHLQGPPRTYLEDAVAQFSLWEGNFPVGKLDLVLQYTSYLRGSLVGILREIAKVLLWICQRSSGVAFDDSSEGIVRQLEIIIWRSASILTDGEGSISSSDQDSHSDNTSLSESEIDLYARLQSLISCLMDLSIALERQSLSMRDAPNQLGTLPPSGPVANQEALPFGLIIRDRFVGFVIARNSANRTGQISTRRSRARRATSTRKSRKIDPDESRPQS
ncbi:hypothetical protein BDV06DRAFT_195166 [Aspergillus oleicola]